MRSPRIATILVLASCAALAACERERERAPTANDAQVAAAPAQAVVELQDVVETRPDYIVGISYPKSANGHPALAHALQAYAEAGVRDLLITPPPSSPSPMSAPTSPPSAPVRPGRRTGAGRSRVPRPGSPMPPAPT